MVDDHTPPLMHDISAVRRGKIDIVKLLLERGVNPEIPTGNGQTPLYMAAYQNHLAIARVLVRGGADINGRGPGGRTPLHIAVREDYSRMIQDLIELGADLHAKTPKGFSALHLAAQILIEEGVDIYARIQDHLTALELASDSFSARFKEFILLLLEARADLNGHAEESLWTKHRATR